MVMEKEPGRSSIFDLYFKKSLPKTAERLTSMPVDVQQLFITIMHDHRHLLKIEEAWRIGDLNRQFQYDVENTIKGYVNQVLSHNLLQKELNHTYTVLTPKDTAELFSIVTQSPLEKDQYNLNTGVKGRSIPSSLLLKPGDTTQIVGVGIYVVAGSPLREKTENKLRFYAKIAEENFFQNSDNPVTRRFIKDFSTIADPDQKRDLEIFLSARNLPTILTTPERLKVIFTFPAKKPKPSYIPAISVFNLPYTDLQLTTLINTFYEDLNRRIR